MLTTESSVKGDKDRERETPLFSFFGLFIYSLLEQEGRNLGAKKEEVAEINSGSWREGKIEPRRISQPSTTSNYPSMTARIINVCV